MRCTSVRAGVIVLALFACHERAATPRASTDAWTRRQPFKDAFGFAELARNRFTPVDKATREEAVLLLESTPLRVLSRDEARRFTGDRPLAQLKGGVTVLLRALRADGDGSKYGPDTTSVYWKDGTVRVVFKGSRLVSDETGMVRDAIVATLPTTPTEVFVDPLVIRRDS